MASEPNPVRESGPVQDPELERQGKRLGGPGLRFLLIGVAIAIVGVIVLVVGPLGVGAAIILLGCLPGLVGVALLVSSGFARWAARHKMFA
ncbi:MAG: hypothetical protein JO153_10480 [Solirubrobacterales bacterium]|nr:hypothetical protein [Solirubrobacterales bacterium]MBV9916914.1 hypothetical protein [Solirubrobacterales bacterium]